MTPRKRLATIGERGKMVRLFLEVRPHRERRYVVEWGKKGHRERASWPATKEGKAEAEAFLKAYADEHTRSAATPEPLTNRELWDLFTADQFQHLRANTQRLYGDAWRMWEQYAGKSSVAEHTSIATILDFRKALDARGWATATVQDCIRNIRIVFNWGERHELLSVNKWHLFTYKVAKEKRTKPRGEYTADEFVRLWTAFDPERRGQWRPWVAVGLLGVYGNRATEILALQWSAITDALIVLDPTTVKTGQEDTLKLFPLTTSILDVARRWRAVEGYGGPYVLFPGQSDEQRARGNRTKEPHYTIQSLTTAIHRAEPRAGVETIRFRAAHGFRRGLVGDLAESTGDVMLALQAVRDRDIRMAPRYRVRRDTKIDEVVRTRAERLLGGVPVATMAPPESGGSPEGATKVQPNTENGVTTDAE